MCTHMGNDFLDEPNVCNIYISICKYFADSEYCNDPESKYFNLREFRLVVMRARLLAFPDS